MNAFQIPTGGFARIPSKWFEKDISVQAKLLLAVLCDVADKNGVSYHSYDQLGKKLQRSKPSISAYVKELRAKGFITVKRQTYRNGYNYRLQIQIVGWTEVLAHWAQLASEHQRRQATESAQQAVAATATGVQTASLTSSTCSASSRGHMGRASDSRWQAARTGQDPERRVQLTERKDPTGLKIYTHLTQTQAAAPQEDWTDKDEAQWRNFRHSDKDSLFETHGTPSRALLEKTIKRAEALGSKFGVLSGEEAKRQALEKIQLFVDDKHLVATPESKLKAAEDLAGSGDVTLPALLAALEALAASWQPHWQRLSYAPAIKAAMLAARESAMPSSKELELLGRCKQRAWIASRWSRDNQSK